MSAALIPHPGLFIGRDEPEIIDERIAMKLGAAYCDGGYMAIERVFAADKSAWHVSAARWAAMNVLHDTYGPSYAEIRDFLVHECNVPLVLAARVALRITRRWVPS